MIKDFLHVLDNNVALTATRASINVLDFGSEGDAIEQLWLVVRVGTVLDSSGEAATLSIAIQTDSSAAMGSATTLYTSETFAEASCTGDTNLIKMRLPLGMEQFMRLYYTVGTENFTSGTIEAFLVKDVEVRI